MEEATAGTRLDTEAQQAVIAVQRLVGRSMTACCEVGDFSTMALLNIVVLQASHVPAFQMCLYVLNLHQKLSAAADSQCTSHTSSVGSVVNEFANARVAAQVVRDVDAACESVLAHGRSVCSTALAEELGQLGYAVAIRESLGGGSGGQCLRNLRHAFLCCMPGEKSWCTAAATAIQLQLATIKVLPASDHHLGIPVVAPATG